MKRRACLGKRWDHVVLAVKGRAARARPGGRLRPGQHARDVAKDAWAIPPHNILEVRHGHR
jgi:hypothetical protein